MTKGAAGALRSTLRSSLVASKKRVLLPAPRLIADINSSSPSDFTFSTNTNVTAEPENAYKKYGRVKLAGNGNNVTLFAKKRLLRVNPAALGTMAFLINKEDAAAVSSYSIQLFRGATSALVTCSTETSRYRAGKRVLCAHIDEFPAIKALGPGLLDFSVRAGQNAPYTTAVEPYAMWSNVGGKGIVIITFDDCDATTYSTAYPLMRDRSIPGNCYVAKDLVGNAGKMTAPQIDELYRANWDIGVNGTSADGTVLHANLPAANADLIAGRDYVLSNGWWRAAKHLCWPNGSWTENTIASFISLGFLSARTTEPASFIDRLGLYDIAMTLPSQGAGSTTQVSVHQARLVEAALRGTVQIFHFHGIKPTPGATEWYVDRFTQFLDLVKAYRDAGKIEVLTLSRWYNRAKNYTVPLPAPL